jgi:hypothetical protein
MNNREMEIAQLLSTFTMSEKIYLRELPNLKMAQPNQLSTALLQEGCLNISLKRREWISKEKETLGKESSK